MTQNFSQSTNKEFETKRSKKKVTKEIHLLTNSIQHCKKYRAKWMPLEKQWKICLIGNRSQSLCWPKLNLTLLTLKHLSVDGVNAPYNKPQKPLASASNVVNWNEVISTGTHEQHSWLLAGAQVGGRAWIEPGHDGDIATTCMNDRSFVFSSQWQWV